MPNFYETKIKDVLLQFETTEIGLTSEEVNIRIKKYGHNRLTTAKQKTYFQIFLSQFKSPLIYILFTASIVVMLMREISDAVIILLILFLNSIIGTIQEGKAQNTLAALKKFSETKATLLRDGKESVIQDYAIVPGDIVLLEEGDKIPADIRIIKSNSLQIDEAVLTGESEPVYKIAESVKGLNVPITDQKNIVFKGTHVVAGNGTGVVIATGINTEIGRISKEIASETDDSPLKTEIEMLSKLILWGVAGIAVLILIIGLAGHRSFEELLKTLLALSVSIIPEGLPIVTTLVLASGVWRMTKRNALVKKLQAVEALGQATIIALDKTGTITKNEMVVKEFYLNGTTFKVDGQGYDPSGNVYSEHAPADIEKDKTLNIFMKMNVLGGNAKVVFSESHQAWIAMGDPTQAAMVCLGQKGGFLKEQLEVSNPRIQEIPFDYKLKYHAFVNEINGKNIAGLIAAPEVMVELSTKISKNGRTQIISAIQRQELLALFEQMSAKGLRVIGVGYKEIDKKLKSSEVKDFIFLGFVGIEDTIRPEAHLAVQEAQQAGIKVVMITGDNKITALAIGKAVGLYSDGDSILTGQEIDKMNDDDLSIALADVSIFARVNPEHKLRIIRAYKRRGDIIAMTGDGVNDAPSLVAADLGVSMGKIGTEVAKEASDIVLLDDNFGSIVSAIDEGRNIYNTIKKVMTYLFAGSIGEVLLIITALVSGHPLPILASQIIWLNFVSESFLDISLAMEPKEEGLLNGRFFKPKKYLIDRGMISRVLIMAIPIAAGAFYVFDLYYQIDLTKAWTVTLTTLVFFQWFNAWNCRHESKSIFQLKFFANKFLIAASLIMIPLQIFAVYHPFMQKYLHTTGLNAQDWFAVMVVASTILLVEETRKYFVRAKMVRV